MMLYDADGIDGMDGYICVCVCYPAHPCILNNHAGGYAGVYGIWMDCGLHGWIVYE